MGLLGELRPVRQMERRLAEAARLGFERCIVPAGDLRRLSGDGGRGKAGRARRARRGVRSRGLLIQGASTVAEALTLALGPLRGPPAGGRATGRTARREARPSARGRRGRREADDGSRGGADGV